MQRTPICTLLWNPAAIRQNSPCTDAIIKAGIKNVYAGITDPNPLVSGKGFKLLSEAGINVENGFHKEEIEKQLEYFITWKTKNRPFVIMKNAVSLDGKQQLRRAIPSGLPIVNPERSTQTQSPG
jgi:hypothetical protein